MIVQVCGTNGSGKSTVVRAVLAQSQSYVPIYGLLGVRHPEAYAVRFGGPSSSVRLFVLGPYGTPCGGCDALTPEQLVQLLAKYEGRGPILFEGAIVSDHVGKVGAFLAQHLPAVRVYMSTSLDECLRRIRERRVQAGNQRPFDETNTRKRYAQILQARRNVEVEGKIRTETLPEDEPVRRILELLHEAG